MKKFLILTISLLFLNSVFAVDENYAGIGCYIIKDYNRKTYIVRVLPNTPAERNLLPVGSELLEINGVKTKKLSINDINKMIRGKENTNVSLLIKNNHKKQTYDIKREKINIVSRNSDKQMFAYWQQIAPSNQLYAYHTDSFSKYSPYLKRDIILVNYWADRFEIFKVGYDTCMDYAINERNACLSNLVNREVLKTEMHRQQEQQALMYRQQAIQDFTNSMNQIQINNSLNNINNNLIQQNMYLNNINNNLRY